MFWTENSDWSLKKCFHGQPLYNWLSLLDKVGCTVIGDFQMDQSNLTLKELHMRPHMVTKRRWTYQTWTTFESPFHFSLNVFTEFAEFTDKNICLYSKKAQTCHPATLCVRDQDATTAPARHMWETGSLNWAQFMLQWFIKFTEFMFHLGKTPIYQ